MSDKIELLRGVSFLKPLHDDVLASIATAIHEVTFASGTRFITEGQTEDAAYIIVEGTADVSVRGRRLRRLSRGDVVGEMAAIVTRSRTASVTTTSPVHALMLSGAFLRDLVKQHPAVGAVLSREMSLRD